MWVHGPLQLVAEKSERFDYVRIVTPNNFTSWQTSCQADFWHPVTTDLSIHSTSVYVHISWFQGTGMYSSKATVPAHLQGHSLSAWTTAQMAQKQYGFWAPKVWTYASGLAYPLNSASIPPEFHDLHASAAPQACTLTVHSLRLQL